METTKLVPIDRIRRIGNIREDEETDIDCLAGSIKVHGLLQPIIVSQVNGGFELVAGHRRYLACKRLGWKEVPAIVKTFDDRQTIQLVENMQRVDLSYVEESRCVHEIRKRTNASLKTLTRLLGHDRAWVQKRLFYHDIRDYLIAAGIIPARLIRMLTYDIALVVGKHDRKYWLQMCAFLLGKRWYPEQIRTYCESVVNPGTVKTAKAKTAGVPLKKGTTQGSANVIQLDVNRAKENEFTILTDTNGPALKLLFATRNGYCKALDVLQKIGGEVVGHFRMSTD